MRGVELEKLRFDDAGLIPCVVQDARTSRVLMLGYMTIEAVERTIESGLVTFFSRSRSKLWVKGETSGNKLTLKELSMDCDSDTLLALVEPEGPTCHNGTTSCFDEAGQ